MKLLFILLSLVETPNVFCKVNEPFINYILDLIQNQNDTYGLPYNFATTPNLVIQQGYFYNDYQVETEDGYLLALHRIKNSKKNKPGPPILMIHGALTASDIWLQKGRESLPYLLSDAGFDVWLGDLRGNYYSNFHVKLNTKSKEFWDTGVHEMGVYDIPAFIDEISKNSEYTKITYIGYSIGSSVFLIMSSLSPEYDKKIDPALLLAPIAIQPQVNDIRSGILKSIVSISLPLKDALHIFEKFNIGQRVPSSIQLIEHFCNYGLLQRVCFDILGNLVGNDSDNYDRIKFGDQAKYLVGGTPSKALYHLADFYKKGFRMFDYGRKENKIRYGTTEAPLYPLHRITAPVGLIWAENDLLTNDRSVNELAESLTNLLFKSKINDQSFSHTSFVFGMNAKNLLYEKIISILSSYKASEMPFEYDYFYD